MPGIMRIIFAIVLSLQCLRSSFVQAYNVESITTPSAARINGPIATRRNFLLSSASTVAGGLSSANIADHANAIPSSSGIVLPPMGLGAWSWGDSLFWGYDSKNDDELKRVFDYAVSSSQGIPTLFDTAEVYGFGRSETLIGKFSQSYPSNAVQVATKFAALPWRNKAQDVVDACRKSIDRLGGHPIDLYQIHFPGAWKNSEYWDGLALAYEQGLVKAVGVSNYGVDAVTACHDALAKRGIPLTSNQIQMSLLYRYPIDNGLLETCQKLNVQVLSYSPLALGMLGGKYTPDQPPSGPRKAVYERLMSTPEYSELLETMKTIANGHVNGTPAQVALNWARAKGTIPIPGARTLSQVQSNYGALAWDLTKDEISALDTASARVTTFIKPEQGVFPTKDRDTGLVMFDS